MNTSVLFIDFVDELQIRAGTLTEDSVRYIFFSCLLRQDKHLNNYTLELPYICMYLGNGQYPYSQWMSLNPNFFGQRKQALDLFYKDTSNNTFYCFEFKFHRDPKLVVNPSASYSKKASKPRTSLAGGIFNDLHRLQLIQSANMNNKYSVRKYLVYVTDALMDKYLGAPNGVAAKDPFRQNLKAFYTLPINSGMTVSVHNNGTTYGNASYQSIISSARPMTLNIINRECADLHHVPCPSLLGNECHIRIYEVVDGINKNGDTIDDWYSWSNY